MGSEQASATTIVTTTIKFSDTEYRDADWSIPDLTDVIFAGQMLTGGHPGRFRRLVMASNEDGVWVPNLNNTFVYNPRAGAILSVTYDIDVEALNGFGAGVYVPLIQQSGILYIARDDINSNAFGGGCDGTPACWRNHLFEPAVASLFIRLAGLRDGKLGPPPDFSTSGSPITFGYAVSAPGTGFFNVDGGIDNDPITLTIIPSVPSVSVPEGSTLGLFGIGIEVLFVMRRKAHRVSRSGRVVAKAVQRWRSG